MTNKNSINSIFKEKLLSIPFLLVYPMVYMIELWQDYRYNQWKQKCREELIKYHLSKEIMDEIDHICEDIITHWPNWDYDNCIHYFDCAIKIEIALGNTITVDAIKRMNFAHLLRANHVCYKNIMQNNPDRSPYQPR